MLAHETPCLKIDAMPQFPAANSQRDNIQYLGRQAGKLGASQRGG
jgi:hypothetical protein